MQRQAFRRARRFLGYNLTATSCAITAAILLGVLYVVLIALVGLFSDLLVEKGQIPLLAAEEEKELLRWLTDEIVEDPEEAAWLVGVRHETGLGLVALAWRHHHIDWRVQKEGEWSPYHYAASHFFAAPARWFGWTRENWSYLTGLLLIAVGLALLRAFLTFVMHYAAATATTEASIRLRRGVYHHTYRLGTLAFQTTGSGEAAGVFTRNLEAVHEGLSTWLTRAFREPVQFFLLLVLALLIDFWLSLAFLIFAVLVWLVGTQLSGNFRRKGLVNAQQAGEQLALLHESIHMMRLVKCYLMELFNQSRVERQLSDYSGSLLKRGQAEAIYRPTLIFLGVLAVAVLLYAAGWAVFNGALSVAGVITLSAALISLYWPIMSWVQQRRTLQRANQAAAAVFAFLDRSSEIGQVVGAEFLQPLARHLELDKVTVREPDTGHLLLNRVSLHIPAGQRVALVGQDEKEKHAAVYLIVRFLDPTEGEVRIDGHDIRWVTLDSLRAQMGVVLQHSLVFNDTVGNNIGCGDPSYSMPQIIEAAKAAHAHHFIQKLPAGYKTEIGELGHALTAGEQFRIALARAILRDPAIVIIEESTTPLDDDTKAMLDDTFARFLTGRTTIFLPHRVSTIRSCDRIYLLHKGRLQAAGDHRELLNQSELYRHLQYVEFNVFAEHT